MEKYFEARSHSDSINRGMYFILSILRYYFRILKTYGAQRMAERNVGDEATLVKWQGEKI